VAYKKYFALKTQIDEFEDKLTSKIMGTQKENLNYQIEHLLMNLEDWGFNGKISIKQRESQSDYGSIYSSKVNMIISCESTEFRVPIKKSIIRQLFLFACNR
jgi:hypothetical protein